MGCGCKEKKAYELPKEGCGCGCGPSCDCADCKTKWHSAPKNGLGRFDEYPRPKAAMFDPRKIMKEWPEPSDDPLIPYVRANEQGLPYEMLNEFHGRPNTLHGWSGLGGVNELNVIKSATKNLLGILSLADQSMVELDNETAEYSRNNLRIPTGNRIGNKVQYRNVKKAPPIKTFFAFVPFITKRGGGDSHEMFIRMGGPEAKSNWWDGDESDLLTFSAERDFIKEMAAYLSTYNGLADVKTDGLRVLQTDYPIYFATGSGTSAKQFRVANNGKDYAGSAEAYQFFGYNVMNYIVSQAWIKLADPAVSDAIKDDIKDMLKYVMQACISRAFMTDVSKAIAGAFAEKLKEDYIATELRSYYEYEVEVFGPNEFRQIDPKLRSVFNKKRADFDASIDALEAALTEALLKVIADNQKSFSDILKKLLDYDNIKDAQKRIADLETQVGQATRGSSSAQDQLSSLEASLKAKDEAIQKQNVQIAELQSEITRQKNNLSSSSESVVMNERITQEQASFIKAGVALAIGAGSWLVYSKLKA